MARRTLLTVAPFSLLLLIIGIDARYRHAEMLVIKEAVIDETAHLATALIVLFCIAPRLSLLRLSGTVIGGTAIDLDHLPALAGSLVLTDGTNRPYTHSALTAVLLILLGVILPAWLREGVWGAALGVTSHVFRDMATGGVPLLWPLELTSYTVPYSVYIVTLAVGACFATVRCSVARQPLARPARSSQ
jgi:inner membrane protein